jgi:hypothetical protein
MDVGTDVASVRALAITNALFAIDAQARNGKMDLAARHALRRQNAPALLDQIRTHILAMSKDVLPKVWQERPAATRLRCGTS